MLNNSNSELSLLRTPTLQAMMSVLENLNQAYRAYDLALPAEIRQGIARFFHAHYLWLWHHEICFGFDSSRQRYFLDFSITKQEDSSRWARTIEY
ncbi:hypothetical protein EPA93_02990 [Ktedonosporobacter rubrisoli]|uniref:Uncharacterized protein n=1 Tax=Ktedonosporobacter rubrisoli TaxID=2509675 RepID=A0A4P6JJ25_KTERU|nr:hypothetical protein [Ktedonosporobacter rubrisoli]QBD75013.1 hypothetical protein EPA93_02990 [Ktedonosporobacter rubrisoli]